MIRVALAVVGVVSLLLPQAPTLETVLSRAAGYVTTYRETAPALVADETYVQISTLYGSTHRDLFATGAPAGEAGERKVRKTKSEFAIVADSSLWLAFRDVSDLDGKSLRTERNRLERALGDRVTAIAAAMAISAESIRHNIGSMNRTVNIPTLALAALLPRNQSGFAFTKKGEKKVGGTSVWVVGYTETERPTLVRTQDGVPQPMRGEIWIDPAGGRVVRTSAVFDSLDAYPDMKAHPERYREFPRTTIEVTYAAEPRLDLWVPVEMKELYDRPSEVVRCTATYSNFRRVPRDGTQD